MKDEVEQQPQEEGYKGWLRGDLEEDPWQDEACDNKSALWQAAAHSRHQRGTSTRVWEFVR
eukprot:12935977-Prorocentrum_lima.AAC.1